MQGDCRETMPDLPPASIHSVVTDPPYGLSFMGKGWDHGVPGVEFWLEVLRVSMPGAYMLAFGGTRTYHRLACAIEDAGWQIRDCIMWVYGSGFPKGKGCLKPAWEPILVARKPGPKVLPLNIDGCRVSVGEEVTARPPLSTNKHEGYRRPWNTDDAARVGVESRREDAHDKRQELGRWPANLIHDGSDEVVSLFPANSSRYFYCAKTSKADRDEGCEDLVIRQTTGGGGLTSCGDKFGSIKSPAHNHHPTVKPTALMRYLVRLVTPTGGTVLDPFAGSGSTGKAAVVEGFDFIGLELDPDYVAIAEARIRSVL